MLHALAYQELQIDRKKEEKKLQNLEGKKREQDEAGHGTGGPEGEAPLGVQEGNAIVLLGTPGGSYMLQLSLPLRLNRWPAYCLQAAQ